MGEPAIRLENVSKTFKGYINESFGRATLNRLRGHAPKRELVHALKDVSFEVHPGQSVALMGLNGSGKTTALSLIARISAPTAGTITIRGRVGALLAVGTGLHGDLTGRENIDVYCRILGYTSADIARRFDDIVEFAEIGYALDRPLKFFSSGMQLRLGFSIAAHVDPEVMLVDEAVSVGDVLFQQRCLDKMAELVQSGSALMLVSHQPEIVARMCRDGMLLRNGELVSVGSMETIVGDYLDETGKVASSEIDESVRLVSWEIAEADFDRRRIEVRATVDASSEVDDPRFGVSVADLQHGPIVTSSMLLDQTEVGRFCGRHTVTCVLDDVPLRAGVYRVVMYATTARGGQLVMAPHVLGHVRWGDPTAAPVAVGRGGFGPVTVPTRWTVD